MEWLSSIRGLILDMDGVLWRGDTPLLELPVFFEWARLSRLDVILATNNATRSTPMYLDRLARFGVNLEPRQVINSPQAAARLLKQRFPQGGPVFVVGEKGLMDSLEAEGFYQSEDDVLAVVAGLDRSLTYPKLSQASTLIRKGALFVGTNPDKTFPTPTGLVPGAGSVIAFLETASGTAPLIAGKPEPYMQQLAVERMGLQADQTLVVGDRLDTDILGGQRAGCRTALVLSGVSTFQEAQEWKPAPDLVLNNLADLCSLLPS